MVNSGLRAPTEIHRVAPGCDVLHTLSVDGTREDSRGRGSVTSNLIRLLRDILNKTIGRSTIIRTNSHRGWATDRAPRFSNLSLRVIDFATVTPSKRMCQHENLAPAAEARGVESSGATNYQRPVYKIFAGPERLTDRRAPQPPVHGELVL